MDKKRIITLEYANLALCLLIYAAIHSQLADYEVNGLQLWIHDTAGGAHTEAGSVKNPMSVLSSLVFIVLLFQVNRLAIRSLFAPPDTAGR